jgi:hypothetical protein
MTSFFIDLWHDLREKRLWPVAVGLLAAIVAVPAVLFKPASDAAPETAVAPRTTSGATLPVVAVDSGPTEGSKLEAFSAKNPFKPMKDLAKTEGSGSGSGSSGGSGSGSGSGDGGSFGGAPAGGGSSDVGSDIAGGSTPSGSGGSGGGSTPSAPGIPHLTWFRYAADFSFGPSGHTEKFKGPQSFTSLPDADHPSIVFLGVSDDGKRALFLIADPAFEAAGEGKCTPKSTCQFVSLRVGDSNDEETFTSVDGTLSYELKLDRIRKEKLDSDADGNPIVPDSSTKSKTTSVAPAASDGGKPSLGDVTEAAAPVAAAPEGFGSGAGFLRESR